MNEILKTIILGIIEGLTEFLPVSSTAHLIVSENLLGIDNDKFLNFFTVFIQLGAISTVPFLYFKRLFASGISVYFTILASFVPAVILGVLLDDFLEALFEGYWFIACSWIIGGIILIQIDKWLPAKSDSVDIQNISYLQAFKIGLFQCIAMIPGVSRSGATIVGGRVLGLSHSAAVEYSFLLGIPTILGASAKKLLDYRHDYDVLFTKEHLQFLGIGTLVSFVVALLTIKWMVGFVRKHGFTLFGYYRIIAGILLSVYLWMS
ncbi:undecaprenyl-diphosphate phosphatase [Aquirufa sp. HETE-83D]|uniref:Undecaprenyl-diphosphatase n=1 Tax=Aquirufa esocilacus TaxID=3096513 RepID=A0ABW6DGC4_9BACT